MKKKILLSVLVHLISMGAFAIIYLIPAVSEFIRNTEFSSRGSSTPLGMVLLILPAIFIIYIWYPRAFNDRANWKSETSVWTKVKLSLLTISQVAITVAYAIALASYIYY
ncbi:MAG: hypothetical protein LBG19_07625 [Prevotellaceae bacterium]|jgi:hypothetical protein|nr:hypothetical protein [Prevotellaceae bacterium]